MFSLHRFEPAALPATHWKNGGGLTREIVCQPPGASLDGFDWRVSLACVASDGPFSRFAGVDRVITLLGGAGLRLARAGGGWAHALDTPLVPFAFAGDEAVDSTLLGGPCQDLNVMTRRSACRARVVVLRGGTALDAAPAGMLLSVRGPWRAGAETLVAGQGLWWADQATAWSLACDEPEAALVAVLIHPNSP